MKRSKIRSLNNKDLDIAIEKKQKSIAYEVEHNPIFVFQLIKLVMELIKLIKERKRRL